MGLEIVRTVDFVEDMGVKGKHSKRVLKFGEDLKP